MSQLKRIRETLDSALGALGSVRSEVERLEAAFDAITGVVEVGRKLRRKQRATKAAPNGSDSAKHGITESILGVFKHGNAALDFQHISALLPTLRAKSVYNALTVMVKKKLLKRTGTMGSYRYSKR